MINQDDAYLYVQDGVIDSKTEAILKRDGIYIKEYNAIYEDVKKKEIERFKVEFKDLIQEEHVDLNERG